MFIKRIVSYALAASLIAGAVAGPAGKKNNTALAVPEKDQKDASIPEKNQNGADNKNNTETPDGKLAPINSPKGVNVIDGAYIVVYKPGTEKKGEITDQAIKKGVKHVYNFNKFSGFAGKFDDDALSKIRSDPSVAFVERDGIMKINVETQTGAPWGLARLSHREKLDSNTQDKYLYDANGGQGVTAYVIDTGILVDHPDFEGRAKWGATFADDGDKDGNGHGTHVAGTIGSKTYGVAKKANLVAVKVLNGQGSGSFSDVIAGINWAANDQKKNGKNKSVANMSLGGGASDAVDEAVNNAVTAGLHMVVAAGNENQDACNSSPARAEKAITVAASDIGDKKASFSNFGKCVTIIAPGVDILSTWNDGQTKSISGTSMASPHVAGLVAHFLTSKPRDPASMKEYIASVANKDKITGFENGTANLLAYNTLGNAAALAA
ncbi:uncharacterized protein VTP21DRAFT_10371 [Calcarisporiella thermophila]|uniref:uncharacterized protein n=1 Tax=Calcarisporiella thermophila TaxID=911321 RepID=UPI0037432C0F